MKSPKNARCYACDEIATTKEHVPPECFFPKKKGFSTESPDYRRHLITVPSCRIHNNFRSKDDEYTAAVVAMNSNTNLAFSIFKSKWVRALLRREGILGKRIFSTARDVQITSVRNGLLIPRKTLAISYEMNRISYVIESIARALYYLESDYEDKWTNECTIRSPNFISKDLSSPQDLNFLTQVVQAFVKGEENQELNLSKKGSNPDVFHYQFFKAERGDSIMRIVFYTDFTFLAFLHEEDFVPSRIIVPAF